jgi:DNA-directed RNA polymerase specialized sigma24 family protein
MALDAQAGPAQRADPGLFATTHWSVVLRAQDNSDAALGALCEAYRQPLVTWLRIRGHVLEDAEDLVQGFFAHILAREFLANIGREKGKFRTFILKCFQHYLSDQRERISAHKRGGGRRLESLDQTGPEGHRIYDPAGDAAPDLEYDRACARSLLERARCRLQEECAGQGHAALYSELEPGLLSEEGASSYKEIAARLDMTEPAVKVAAHRIRIRLRGLMREEVLQTVATEEDWLEEIRYLIGLFSR